MTVLELRRYLMDSPLIRADATVYFQDKDENTHTIEGAVMATRGRRIDAEGFTLFETVKPRGAA